MAREKQKIPLICPWWAKIIKKPGSDRLYIKMSYHGQYPEKSTKLKDTPENRAHVQAVVDAINQNLALGMFAYSDVFIDAPVEEQRFFAAKEKRDDNLPPSAVTFRDAYAVWEKERFKNITSKSTQSDYMKAINPHILPFFEGMTFNKISKDKIEEFFRTRYLYGDSANGLVSKRRMLNIKIPLLDIWSFSESKWKWGLESPFDGIAEYIDQITSRLSIDLTPESMNDPKLLAAMVQREKEKESKNVREVILFSNYLKVLKCLDDFYKPEIELFLLTAISPSEMAGLHVESIQNELLRIQWSLTDNQLRDYQKTKSRTRDIPITKAIKRVLDAAKAKSRESIFAFQSITGLHLRERPLRDAWYRASDKAGVKQVCPYSLRHSFVAYCELMGIDKPRIIGLMGHQDKSMIDNVYGKYANGSEKEIHLIKEYFGEDFWGK